MKSIDNNNTSGLPGKETIARSFLLWSAQGYVLIGVIIVLVGITIDQGATHPANLWLRVLVDFLSTIGIAILVAGLFSFYIGTNDFLAFISEMLQRIVVNRAFLRNMDDRAKKNMLRSVLRPNDSQRDVYGNIESYYTHHIERSMTVSSTSVRSNYTCYCYVYYSNADQCIVCEYTNTYRVYPSQVGYDDITVGFYGEDGTLVSYESIVLFFPNGTTKKYDKEAISAIEPVRTGKGDEEIRIEIASFANEFDHVDVEFRVFQKGDDHWIQIGFQALQPTDGFRLTVHCEDPLQIKEEQTFIYGAEKSKDPENIKGCGRAVITCQQWIDQGAGVAVLVAAPHQIDDEVLSSLAERSHNYRRDGERVHWQPLGRKRPPSLHASDDSPSNNRPPAAQVIDVETAAGHDTHR